MQCLMLAVAASLGYTAGAPGENLGTVPEKMAVRLHANPLSAGQIGYAFLVGHPDRTDVTIELSGVPDSVAPPVHLYTYIDRSTCSGPSTRAYSLNGHVLASAVGSPARLIASRGPIRVTNTAPLPMAALQASPHAIEVRTSPDDGDQQIFCGDIG